MITSTKNPRIVEANKLTHRKYRQRQDRFLVDGLQLLDLALQNGRAKPRQVFYCDKLFTGDVAPGMLQRLAEAGAELIAVSPNVIASLSDRDTPQGLVATFAPSEVEFPEFGTLTGSTTGRPRLVIILDKLQDPGNLGTLIRTADAVGASAVFLIEPIVDPFDPKTVRGTMGSLFTMPFTRVKNPAKLFSRLSEIGYQLIGADGRLGQTVWQTDMLVGPTALVLGNEARGLSEELHSYLTNYVSLPLCGQAESLNVAVAGGTLMYEWLRMNEHYFDCLKRC
jgi:TrmH family RNA methyltransferase